MSDTRPPRRVFRSVGAVGVLLNAGAVAMWDAGPAWYSLAVIVIAMPCAWAGGGFHKLHSL